MPDESLNEVEVEKGGSVPFDRDALEAKIAGRLAEVDVEVDPELDEAADTDEAEEVEEVEEADDADEESEEGDESSEASEAAESETDEEAAEGKTEQPAAKSKPTLPAAYRRTLQAYEWTDEEIDEAFTQNPTGFLVTASKLHRSRSDEIARWAQLGRASRENVQEGGDDSPAPAKGKGGTSSEAPGLIPLIDAEAIAEKYGDEELVGEIVGPVNDAIKRINAYLPDLTASVSEMQAAKKDQLAREVDSFFTSNELKPYSDLYGESFETGTPDQQRKRVEVLQTADALVIGAKLQGRSLKASEALALAHDSVSAGHKVAAVRKEVKSSVKKRAKGVTLKPSRRGGKSTESDAPARNRAELEAKVASRLSSINW